MPPAKMQESDRQESPLLNHTGTARDTVVSPPAATQRKTTKPGLRGPARDGDGDGQAALSQGGAVRDEDASAQGLSEKRSLLPFPPLDVTREAHRSAHCPQHEANSV